MSRPGAQEGRLSPRAIAPGAALQHTRMHLLEVEEPHLRGDGLALKRWPDQGLPRAEGGAPTGPNARCHEKCERYVLEAMNLLGYWPA